MAYRKIHDDFWTDPDIEELTPEQKFFYLYLITNPNVNQIGLYEFSIKRACFETGYNTDTISKLLNTFEEMGKIKKSTKTKEIVIIKFYFHNKSNSPKVIKHVEGLLRDVKDTALIQYIYCIDTQSQEEEEEVQEEVQEEETEPKGSFIPTLSEVQDYFKQNGYSLDVAERAYNMYNTSIEDNPKRKYWRDSRDNIIKNWKLKMQSVWFKPENKNQQEDNFNPETYRRMYQ